MKVGDYVMHHPHDDERGTLVLLKDERDHQYRVEYVQILPDRKNIICGGGSFWWRESEFRPITDPTMIAAARLYEARRLVAKHQAEVAKWEMEATTWQAALTAIAEATAELEPDKPTAA